MVGVGTVVLSMEIAYTLLCPTYITTKLYTVTTTTTCTKSINEKKEWHLTETKIKNFTSIFSSL